MTNVEKGQCLVKRTTFFGWPHIYRGGYRVIDENEVTRWFREHKKWCRFHSAVLEHTERRVEIVEEPHEESDLHVVHAVKIDGTEAWLLENYDRRMWSSPSYRVKDLNGGELLNFPKECWERENIFGHALRCSPNDQREVRIFEHGGVVGHGWPTELLIGSDLSKEAWEP